MNILWSILSLGFILIPIFGMSPEEQKKIRKLFGQKYAEVEKLYKDMDSVDILTQMCNQLQPKDVAFALMGYRIKARLVYARENVTITATLDGQINFKVPAFIECLPHKKDVPSETDNYALMVTKLGRYPDYYRFIAHKISNTDWKLEFEVVSHTRLFKKNYEDRKTIMTDWYHQMEKLESQPVCLIFASLLSRRASETKITTEKGWIQLGEYKLLLDHYQKVILPGIITCELIDENGVQCVRYFVYNPEHEDVLNDIKKIKKYFILAGKINETSFGVQSYLLP